MSDKRPPRFFWPPRSLFGRLMLIWLLGITAIVVVTVAVFVAERGRATRMMAREHWVRDAVQTVAVLEQLPPAERAAWLSRLDRDGRRFQLGRPVAGDAVPMEADPPVFELLREKLPGHPVALYLMPPDKEQGRPPRRIAVVDLSDGTPLQLILAPPPFPVQPAMTLGIFALVVIAIVLLSWIAVRVATRPLSQLANAARALGEDLDAPPLPESGPSEVSHAAQAFNTMQQRLRDLFAERTRILAAVSHDLQTPITRLRLRAEMLDDELLKEKMLSDLQAMQSLVEEGLTFARGVAAPLEDKAETDLNALVASLAADYADEGKDVASSGAMDRPVATRPATLRRLLMNLVDNAVKFGGRARILLGEHEGAACISIEDDGPGIPQSELERVFQPFVRLEESRNRDTGGTGLGLAIARQLARQMGASLTLANRTEGGLVAKVRLS